MRRHVFETGAVALILAGMAAAGVWTVRVACADWQSRAETVTGLERAIELTPDQAEYYARLAAAVSVDDPAKATKALEQAVALKPADARNLISLGLSYEAQGNSEKAESYLLQAARVDRQYLPAWTLANFYLRRDNEAQFWHWAERSGAMVYGDPAPLFRLCGSWKEDGNLIDRLHLRRPEVRAAYLSYLLGQGRTDIIGAAVERVFELARKEDVAVLLSACDRLIGDNRVPAALRIWNRLAAAKQIPFRQIEPGGESLTNGTFATEPSSRGFDWRLRDVAGVSAFALENGRGIRLTFSGKQPESCTPLVQFVPVETGGQYEVRFTYGTSGIASGSGLCWRVFNANTDRVLAESQPFASDQDRLSQFRFSTPAGVGLVRLELNYQRAAGTTRIEGLMTLREVAVRAIAATPGAPKSASVVLPR